MILMELLILGTNMINKNVENMKVAFPLFLAVYVL